MATAELLLLHTPAGVPSLKTINELTLEGWQQEIAKLKNIEGDALPVEPLNPEGLAELLNEIADELRAGSK